MANYAEEQRPLHDEAVPLPRQGFKAGGADQGDPRTRKNQILATGSIGHVPGNNGSGPRSSLRAGYVHEAPGKSGRVVGTTDLEYANSGRRPMPKDTPMEEEMTRAGRRVRFLDGSNRLMLDRPGMVAAMAHPDTHPEDKADLRQAIAERDGYHGHVYW